ncbi:MAG: hypothetical protein IPG67_15155 [Acidobacteria bacterium]|nr:hypothetical protein [Acidobacteriota bacterium]MBK7935339.1 hypothetical protein [Acidobacteriota bacterium]
MLDAFIIAISSTIVIWAVIRVLAHLSAYSNERAKGSRPAIFPKTSFCERCEKNIPRTKRLKSVGDHLFGGWACPKCGSEYDLLGNVRVARSHDGHLRDSQRRAKRKRKTDVSFHAETPTGRSIDE